MVSWGQNGITNVKHWTQCLARRECSVGGERSIPAEPVWAEAQSWECVHAELIRREERGVYRGLSQPRRQGFGDTEEALTVGPFLLLSPQLSSSAVTRRPCPPRCFCPCICCLFHLERMLTQLRQEPASAPSPAKWKGRVETHTTGDQDYFGRWSLH